MVELGRHACLRGMWEFSCTGSNPVLGTVKRQSTVSVFFVIQMPEDAVFRLEHLFAVMLGGGLGAGLRYLVSVWTGKIFSSAFPVSTFIVNALGCFFMGFIMTLAADRIFSSSVLKFFLTTGFLGGLTTFSTFSYETWTLMKTGSPGTAVINVLVSFAAGLLAVWAGIKAADIF